MGRPSRKSVIPNDEVGHYHIYNRCVRGAFLMASRHRDIGSLDPRKDWIQTHMAHLCQGFAVEVCDFSIMENHFHLILRNRPDLVSRFGDEEAARRWWHLRPLQRDVQGLAVEPRPFQLRLLLDDAVQMELIRKRLSDISCFMQLFSEYIARRANREDGQRGRFFEQRYKATRLLDEGSLLACSVYVNLNPIRAGLAESPETSRYTSGFERIQALRAWQQQVGSRVPLGQLTEQEESQIESVLFVCPLRLTSGWALATMVPPNTYGAPRASDRGFLPLGLVDYLQLLDWTGRQLRHDKRGSIPSHLLPILDRLQVDSLHWLDIVDELPGVLRSAAGRRECLKQEAQHTGRQWVRGIGISREHFG